MGVKDKQRGRGSAQMSDSERSHHESETGENLLVSSPFEMQPGFSPLAVQPVTSSFSDSDLPSHSHSSSLDSLRDNAGAPLPEGSLVSLAGMDMEDVEVEVAPDPMLGQVLGNFRIVEVIGAGGFGTVYRAEHTLLGESFAVKLLKPGSQTDAGVIKRFQREARVLAQLKHEHIVSLSDFGLLPSGGFYIIMEYLEGKSLQDRLRAGEPFPIPRMRLLVSQFCQVLGYIHRKGVVHRDIKPGNIFLEATSSGEERVKLIDFGIAALHEDNEALTQTEAFLGTAKYASPEQIIGEHELDERSDLYSFAVILYRLIAGRLPFRGKSVMGLINMQLNMPPPTLSELYPGRAWSPRLEAFLQKALAKRPDDRPQDANEFGSMCEIALLAQMELDRAEDQSMTGIFQRPSRKTGSSGSVSFSRSGMPHSAEQSGLPLHQSERSQSASLSVASPSVSLSEHSISSRLMTRPGVITPLPVRSETIGTELELDTSPSPLAPPFSSGHSPDIDDEVESMVSSVALSGEASIAAPAASFGSSFWLRFLLFTCLGVGFGYGVLYGMATYLQEPGGEVENRSAVRRPVRAVPRVVVRRGVPKERVVPRRSVPKVIARPVAVRRPKPVVRRRKPVRRVLRVLPVRRRWKKRKKRRIVKKPIKRRAVPVGPCGVAPDGKHFVFARMKRPTSGRPRVRLLGCASCRMTRKAGGYCFLLPKSSGAAKVSVILEGYQPCIHSIRSSHAKVMWKLREDNPGELSMAGGSCASYSSLP
jgi:serine/threonine protein kinase